MSWAGVGFVVVILLCFYALAVVCDDYLCTASSVVRGHQLTFVVGPAIEIFCEKFAIPDHVAGASFVAFGSAAPEIAISAVATFKTSGASDVTETGFSLPTIFGSAMIAFGA
jgi:Ca2+/Na+ antiporter